MPKNHLAQALQDILKELDASYAPSRQLIQQQIDAIPGQEQAQQSGLEATQANAFQDITNGARDRGVGFSGIPLSEQAKYTASTFLPAVANLKASTNNQKTSLLGALTNSGIDQQKTAFGIQQQQQANDAAGASNAALASLFAPQAMQPTQALAPDKYAAVDRGGAQTAIASLLRTGNVALINQTLNAIKASAGHGNAYDQYKLELIDAALKGDGNAAYNPVFANLIKSAQAYKAPAPRVAPPDNFYKSGLGRGGR